MKHFKAKLLEPGEIAEFHATFTGDDGTRGTILLRTHKAKDAEKRMEAAAIVLCGELQ